MEKPSEQEKPMNEDPQNSAQESSEVTLPREEYESLIKRLEELEGLREKLMRSAADFENAKKRLARERDDFVKFSQENFIRSILPVLDNFERALLHAQSQQQNAPEESQSLKGLVSGIQMVHKQFMDALKSQGLSRVQALGEVFDPHKHEALAHVPEEGPEDIVIQELEPGYMLHDRLLRAAKVNVRVAPPASADSKEAS